MTHYWFRLHKAHYGWVPITWQGWVLTLAFLAFVVYNFFRIHNASPSITDTLIHFVPQTLIISGFFSVLCYLTAEKSSGKNMLE